MRRIIRGGRAAVATLFATAMAVAGTAVPLGSTPTVSAAAVPALDPGELAPLDPTYYWVDENQPADTLVATFPATDGTGQPITYTFFYGDPAHRVALVANELRTTATLDHESGGFNMELLIDSTTASSTRRDKIRVHIGDVIDTLPYSDLREPVMPLPGQLEVRWLDDTTWPNSRAEQFTLSWPGGSAVVPIGPWGWENDHYLITGLRPGPVTVTLTTSNSFGSTSVTETYTIGGESDWPASFTAVTPTRVLDTRPGAPIGYDGAKPAAGDIVELQIAGRDGVPADAIAVALNLTATDATDSGYVTVFPSGGSPPNVSSVNVEAGATAANSAIVRVGGDGKVAVFTERGAHLIVDVAGYWAIPLRTEYGPDYVRGRLTPVTPKRVLDTRAAGKPPVAADGIVTVNPQQAGVPNATADAVVLNVTATQATGPGYVTVWPAQTPRPNVSNLNLASGGQTVANQVIVPITERGFSLYTEAGTHLVVDMVGYFSKFGGPATDPSGLFVPVEPFRQVDTRLDAEGKLPAGYEISFTEASQLPADMPSESIAAFALNVTATAPDGPGYVAVYPCTSTVVGTSTLNLDRAGQTVPNAATGPAAEVCVGTSVTTHLIADVFGYYLS